MNEPRELENRHAAAILIAAFLGSVVSVFSADSSKANSYDTEIEHAPAVAKPLKPAGTHKPSSYDMEIEPFKPQESSASPKHKVTRPTSQTPPTKALRKELAKNPELGFKCTTSNAVVVAELTGLAPLDAGTPSRSGPTARATFKPLEFLKGPDLTNPISIDYSSAPRSEKRSKIANYGRSGENSTRVVNNTVPIVGSKYILFLIEQEDGSWRFYQGHDTKLPYTKENLSAVERILKAEKTRRLPNSKALGF